MNNRRGQGFTLIELLVVIAVIGIMLAATLPGLASFTARLSLHASAKCLTSEIRSVQAQAISCHETTSLDLGRLSLPAGIKLIKASQIAFAASGFTPPGGSGTLILGNKFGQQKKVIVSSAGRVRLE